MGANSISLTTRQAKDGKNWEVTFTHRCKPRSVKVTAKNLNGRDILRSPENTEEILDILPIENWPAFAIQIASNHIPSNQERLF